MPPITITQNIAQATAALASGRLLAFPTSTSYGLAADTQQGWALQRLRTIKQRPAEKSFTVFMRENLWDTYLELTARERALLQRLANKPLTLLVKPAPLLSHLAQEGRVGLRVIDHPIMQQLSDAVTVPLTATSANFHGQPPCYSPADIQKVFSNPLPDALLGEENPRGSLNTTYDLSLAIILDGGSLPIKKPTTIAKVVGDTIEIIRPGELTSAHLQ